MEYEYTVNKYICSEPPVIQKTREVFSSSILILAAIFGLISVAILPVFFVFKQPTGDVSSLAKTLLINDFAVFLPNLFLFISALIMCLKLKNEYRQIKPSAFFAFYLFVILTPLTTLCLFCDEFDVLSNISHLSVVNIIAVLTTVLMVIIHIIAACSLKTAVKFNIPRRSFLLLSAIVFLLCEAANTLYILKNIFLKAGGEQARFQYAECIGAALFIAMTLTASVIFTVRLITYYVNIGKVKKAFNFKESL